MMIVSSVYSIVDGFFVSNFVGKNEFAAVNMVMPAAMALIAFGYMIGAGGSALVAKTMGEGDLEKANQYFSMLIYVTIVFGIISNVIGMIFIRPISVALGASNAIIDDCVLYGRIILLGNAAVMLHNCFQNFLVVAEKPKFGLLISVIAGVCNIVLDFFLVYVFSFGLAGAAAATVISQFVGAAIPITYFLKNKKGSLHLVKAKINWRALGKSCSNGSSEMLANLSASFVGMLYNYQLMHIASEDGVAAYGVIMYVNFIFMAFFFGFSVGSAPVISFNYGAANHSELKGLYKKSLIIIGAAAVLMFLLAEFLSRPLAVMFVGYDQKLLDMTVTAFRLYSIGFLMAGFNIFGSAFFTALNNGFLSAVISFMRTLVVQVVCIIFMPKLFGINGIWISVAVAEFVTLIITVILLYANRKKYHYV